MVREVKKKSANFTTKIEVPKTSVKRRKIYPIIPGWSKYESDKFCPYKQQYASWGIRPINGNKINLNN